MAVQDMEEAKTFLMCVKRLLSKKQYTQFLGMLVAYKDDKVDIERVDGIAKQLLASCPSLAKKFRSFLPDRVLEAPRYTLVGEPFKFPVGTSISSLALVCKVGVAEDAADHVS